ncbi:hypothetical protein A1Q2_04473 [Trichosporon asahii var. asahii CBS 8904]|uniref:Uncharacterized protein n=1 Tax=Trichosporon asahii var. asahii (strain CBS 8904) TaxID=1220162 RepID=K1VWR3_TRIAC|nr:hypothetical protein A1Q2_04473 [Trichosporon asahii var. asahii CBS 8904]
MSLIDADIVNGRTLGPSVATKPEPKSAQDYFPRSRWDELMQPRKEAAQSSMADRIRYATRLASEHWGADVREQAEDCINVDLCKLAVLDKVFEMCEEYRQLQEHEPRDFEAWRAISAGFVGKAVQLAIPWPDHFSQHQWEEIRRFVLMAKDHGYRPWTDAWCDMPELPKFDHVLLKRYDPASREVPLRVKTWKKHIDFERYSELVETESDEDWRGTEEDWNAVLDRQEAERREEAQHWWTQAEERRARDRKRETWRAIGCYVILVPMLCWCPWGLFRSLWEAHWPYWETEEARQARVAMCIDNCVARCNRI